MNWVESLAYYWRRHGTKALGSLGIFVASAHAAVLVMDGWFSPKQLALLAGLNAFFSAWTVKRGFYNSRQNVEPQP